MEPVNEIGHDSFDAPMARWEDSALASPHHLRNNFRNILNLHLLFGLDTLNPILKHRNAERTGRSQHFRISLQCLIDAEPD